jgi:hypothetical protein
MRNTPEEKIKKSVSLRKSVVMNFRLVIWAINIWNSATCTVALFT